MPHTEADDGCEIWFESGGHGRAIVFVSGFMGITDIWRTQVAAFRDAFHCVTWDTRGAGRSDKPVPDGAYGVARHARDLAAVLDAAGVDKALFVGHSMGGNIACEFRACAPERFAGIVFVGSYVAGAQIAAVGNTLARITASVTKPSARIRFFESVGLPFDIAVEAAKWPLHAVLGNAASFMAFDGTAALRRLDVPCLVVHGSEDIVSPYEPCATGLMALLPQAELLLLDGVNHCPMIERPQAVNERIARFASTLGPW